MSFPPPTPGQARVIWAALTGLSVAVIVALIAALIWGLGRILGLLGPVLWPLAVAGVTAYLLDPVVDFFERKGVPRARAILCVFAIAVVLVGAWFGSVLPQVILETRQLVAKIPTYATRLENRAEHWITNPPATVRRFLHVPTDLPVTTNVVSGTNAAAPVTSTNTGPATVGPGRGELWGQWLDPAALHSATGWVARLLPKVGSWLFGQVSRVASWFGFLAGLVLVPVYAFYLLLEKRGIESKWADYLPVVKSEFKDELVFVLNAINGYLIVFFRGQVLVAMCDGVLYTLGFLIIGLPYAVLLGVVATVLTIIPFLGAIVTCLSALIIALVQFGDWLHPALVLVVFGVVQTLEGLVISPKIMGDRVGLHPLTIIIAVMAGTTLLGGILGGILAIPLTAALRVVMSRYIWKRRQGASRPAAPAHDT
jgi:predicted PurR-regulated permease PerM